MEINQFAHFYLRKIKAHVKKLMWQYLGRLKIWDVLKNFKKISKNFKKISKNFKKISKNF